MDMSDRMAESSPVGSDGRLASVPQMPSSGWEKGNSASLAAFGTTVRNKDHSLRGEVADQNSSTSLTVSFKVDDIRHSTRFQINVASPLVCFAPLLPGDSRYPCNEATPGAGVAEGPHGGSWHMGAARRSTDKSQAAGLGPIS